MLSFLRMSLPKSHTPTYFSLLFVITPFPYILSFFQLPEYFLPRNRHINTISIFFIIFKHTIICITFIIIINTMSLVFIVITYICITVILRINSVIRGKVQFALGQRHDIKITIFSIIFLVYYVRIKYIYYNCIVVCFNTIVYYILAMLLFYLATHRKFKDSFKKCIRKKQKNDIIIYEFLLNL